MLRRRLLPSGRLLPLLALALVCGTAGLGSGGCGLSALRGVVTGPQRAIPPSSARQFEVIRRLLSDAADALNRGRESAAESYLKEALARLGGDSSAYAAVGRGLTERGHAAKTVELLEPALRHADRQWDPALWFALAEAAGQTGNTTRQAQASAEAECRADAILEAGRSAADSKQKAQAVERLWLTGFYFLDDAKDTARALKAWRAALDIAPNDAGVLNAVGYTLADEGTTPQEFEEALELTRKALDLDPKDPSVRDSYGWALYKTGDLPGARRILREAADQLPDHAEIRYHLGVVYAALKQFREADNEFARALRIRPDYEEAKRDRTRLPKLPPLPDPSEKKAPTLPASEASPPSARQEAPGASLIPAPLSSP